MTVTARKGPGRPYSGRALSAIALAAQRPYWLGEYGILLRPVPFHTGERTALLESITGEMEVVWTRP